MSRLSPLTWCLAILTVAVPMRQRDDRPILTARTDLVTLSVTVTDRRGAPATDLRQEDFTVYDNGRLQPIEFFTADTQPTTIGLLIDSSGSMRARRGEVTLAVAAFAPEQHPDDEFFTLNFNEHVWPGLPTPLAVTRDPGQLQAALLTAPARGLTALFDAVEYGLRHLARRGGRRQALVLISDGGDNASRHTFDAIVEHARRADVVIYSVTLLDPDNRDARPQVLRSLAHETGGAAFQAADRTAAARSFARVARELRSAYTIGFAPDDSAAVGFRALRVTVETGDGRRLVARTRAGYYAGPSADSID